MGSLLGYCANSTDFLRIVQESGRCVGLIELHLDLDGTGEEYHTGHCWLPDEIAPVIRRIRQGFLADGQGFKEPVPAELPDREWRADPVDGLRPFKHVRESWTPA